MEDYKDILWLLVIAGSVIASVVSKSKKEGDKKSSLPEAFPMPAAETLQSDNEPHHASREAAAGERDFRPANPVTTPRKTPQATTPAPFPHDREFVRPVGVEGPMQTPEAIFATSDEALRDMLPEPPTEAEAFAFSAHENVATTPDPAAAGRVADATETDLLTDFDLRKAILWSEVLKPKFEEI